jgi:hypothetical protein
MKRTNFDIFLGVMLIAAGVLFLLQTFNILEVTWWGVVWAVIFGGAGLAFMWRFVGDRIGQWWAVIPGMILLALAVLTGADGLGFDTESYNWRGVLFLAAIGLSFWVVFLSRPERWWAIIPGGTLLTLAAVAFADDWFQSEVTGAILFFGLAITFGLLYFVPTPRGRMTWALIPAGGLMLLGLMVSLSLTEAFNYLWALGLIVAGVYLLYRQIRGGAAASRS